MVVEFKVMSGKNSSSSNPVPELGRGWARYSILAYDASNVGQLQFRWMRPLAQAESSLIFHSTHFDEQSRFLILLLWWWKYCDTQQQPLKQSLDNMAAFIRGKQAGIQNDLSAAILPGLFAPDDQARFGINSQIRWI